MLEFNIRKQVLCELFLDKNNIIFPWGFETSDSWSFYSMEDGLGYRYDEKVLNEKIEVNKYNRESEIYMREGSIDLKIEDHLEKNCIIRSAQSVCLEDTYLLDYVLRFRFKKRLFKYALIGNEKIEHKNQNIYHQYPVDCIRLVGEDLSLNIGIEESIVPDKMAPFMYVRDQKDEWVIHARMLPVTHDKTVIKLCNSWYKTKPIPSSVSKLILSSKRIKKYLMYRGEKGPYFKFPLMRFVNPNAFPLVFLKKDTQLKWKVRAEIIKEKNEI